MIDSTGVLELIEHLESRYGSTIPDEDLVPENFDSIAGVRARRSSSARTARDDGSVRRLRELRRGTRARADPRLRPRRRSAAGSAGGGRSSALSGGVDSSVVPALCARALRAGQRARADDARSGSRRRRHARAEPSGAAATSASRRVVEDITPALEAFGCYRRRDEAVARFVPGYTPGWRMKIVLPPPAGGAASASSSSSPSRPTGSRRRRLPADEYRELVAATNFKQRARKTLEYFHADRLNYAVAGTPNRLEYDQGFFVKNGDGAADVKPIAHLYKTQVYGSPSCSASPEEIRARHADDRHVLAGADAGGVLLLAAARHAGRLPVRPRSQHSGRERRRAVRPDGGPGRADLSTTSTPSGGSRSTSISRRSSSTSYPSSYSSNADSNRSHRAGSARAVLVAAAAPDRTPRPSSGEEAEAGEHRVEVGVAAEAREAHGGEIRGTAPLDHGRDDRGEPGRIEPAEVDHVPRDAAVARDGVGDRRAGPRDGQDRAATRHRPSVEVEAPLEELPTRPHRDGVRRDLREQGLQGSAEGLGLEHRMPCKRGLQPPRAQRRRERARLRPSGRDLLGTRRPEHPDERDEHSRAAITDPPEDAGRQARPESRRRAGLLARRRRA